MTRLTDAELEELELVAASNAGKRTLRCVCDTLPALLAELRALRAVRDAAERYREASKAYQELMDGASNDVTLAMSRQDARIALFAALDAARGEA